MRLLTRPHNICLYVSRQAIHTFIQSSAVILCQSYLQRMTERALQTAFPALAPLVQIGSPPGQLAGWVYLHTICRLYDPNHLPFWQNFAATHACPLGHMFHTLNRFLRHLYLKSLLWQ
jgi:hypothetical protein